MGEAIGLIETKGYVAIIDACDAMCKAANETDDNLPRAYMYSILFMLAIPATLFTGFGIGIYRLNKREERLVQEDDAATVDDQNAE